MNKLRLASFLIGLTLIVLGILNLYYGHLNHHLSEAAGVWFLVIGAINILVSRPWK